MSWAILLKLICFNPLSAKLNSVKRDIMSTLTLIVYFGQINDVEKFKFDLIECLYNYVVIHNIN